MTKDEIIADMRDKMPFAFAGVLVPYVKEAMEIYAYQIAIDFKKWHDANLEDKYWEQYDGYDRWINPSTREVKTTSQLYELFLIDRNS